MPKILEWTDEIIDEMGKVSDHELSTRSGISRRSIQRKREQMGIVAYTKLTYRDTGGKKWCPNCGEYKGTDEFPRSKNRWDGLAQYCKPCFVEKTMLRRKVDNGVLEQHKRYIRKWKQTDDGKRSVARSRVVAYEKRRDTYIRWSSDDEAYIRNKFGHRCAYCGTEDKLELEHFIPVYHGGKAHPGNLLYACGKCNHGVGGKHKKMPLDWLIEKYGEGDGRELYEHICGILVGHYKAWQEEESE